MKTLFKRRAEIRHGGARPRWRRAAGSKRSWTTWLICATATLVFFIAQTSKHCAVQPGATEARSSVVRAAESRESQGRGTSVRQPGAGSLSRASEIVAPRLPAPPVASNRPSTGLAASGGTKASGVDRAQLRWRFHRVLWQRLRGPLFLFVLGIVFIILLLLSLRSRRPSRLRSVTGRSIILSLVIHLMLLLVLDSWVLSRRIIQTIRDQEFEILIDSDNLAEERLSLGMREETAQLPLADSSLAIAPQWSELPVPEIEPVEQGPEVLPGRIEEEVVEIPPDLAEPKVAEVPEVEVALAAQPRRDFRIAAPRLVFQQPRPTRPVERQPEPALKPEMPVAKLEEPVEVRPKPEQPRVDLPPTEIAPTYLAARVEAPTPPVAMPEMLETERIAKPLPEHLAVAAPQVEFEIVRQKATTETLAQRLPEIPRRVEKPREEPAVRPRLARAGSLRPGAPRIGPLAALPSPVGLPTGALPEPLVPRRSLVPRPSPKPVPPPFVLEERPVMEEVYRLRQIGRAHV